jgi:hypothetical protein
MLAPPPCLARVLVACLQRFFSYSRVYPEQVDGRVEEEEEEEEFT